MRDEGSGPGGAKLLRRPGKVAVTSCCLLGLLRLKPVLPTSRLVVSRQLTHSQEASSTKEASSEVDMFTSSCFVTKCCGQWRSRELREWLIPTVGESCLELDFEGAESC